MNRSDKVHNAASSLANAFNYAYQDGSEGEASLDDAIATAVIVTKDGEKFVFRADKT